MIKLLNPSEWPDYELIDTGDYEKLERFGKYVLRRPEPQAVWSKSLSEKEWEQQTNAWFKRDKTKLSNENSEKGQWILKSGMPQQWYMTYICRDVQLTFRLGLTAFKHVGIFPEQAANWDFIYDRCLEKEGCRALNLFAYTGGASLAAKAAGADVTHVDSVKQVLTWSRGNMESSGLDGIRWVCEDALKFVKREVRRGSRYNCIILDPPAYGRGPEGEKWVLENQIAELMDACGQLADSVSFFCVLNLYSMGFSSLIAENLFRQYFPKNKSLEVGELYLEDRSGRKLPLSVFGRG